MIYIIWNFKDNTNYKYEICLTYSWHLKSLSTWIDLWESEIESWSICERFTTADTHHIDQVKTIINSTLNK